MNFNQYLREKNLSNNSIRSYEYTVSYFTKWLEGEELELEQLNYNDITAYIKTLQNKGNTQRTIQMQIGVLKHYFNYLYQTEIVKSNIVAQVKIQGIKRQSLYDILKQEELEYIYQNYPTEHHRIENIPLTPVQKRNRIILSLLIYQGLTTTGLSNIKLEHLKLAEGTIQISQTPKSNGRTLRLEPFQILELQHYMLVEREEILKETGKESEQLIVSTGTSDKIMNLTQILINSVKKSFPKLKNTKQIRASVITGWLKHYNLREVQYRAGHRFVSSTENYKVNDIESLQHDITKFSPSI